MVGWIFDDVGVYGTLISIYLIVQTRKEEKCAQAHIPNAKSKVSPSFFCFHIQTQQHTHNAYIIFSLSHKINDLVCLCQFFFAISFPNALNVFLIECIYSACLEIQCDECLHIVSIIIQKNQVTCFQWRTIHLPI